MLRACQAAVSDRVYLLFSLARFHLRMVWCTPLLSSDTGNCETSSACTCCRCEGTVVSSIVSAVPAATGTVTPASGSSVRGVVSVSQFPPVLDHLQDGGVIEQRRSCAYPEHRPRRDKWRNQHRWQPSRLISRYRLIGRRPNLRAAGFSAICHDTYVRNQINERRACCQLLHLGMLHSCFLRERMSKSPSFQDCEYNTCRPGKHECCRCIQRFLVLEIDASRPDHPSGGPFRSRTRTGNEVTENVQCDADPQRPGVGRIPVAMPTFEYRRDALFFTCRPGQCPSRP